MTNKQKQWQLFFLGYYTGKIDGIWGEKSRSGTLLFQMDFFPDRIAWDGIFGASTEAKSREIIDAIQDVVTAYADKLLVNDGLAGPATVAATKAFQEAMGLPATGIADKDTRTSIEACGGYVTREEAENDDFWDDIEYFDREEFKCKCGGKHCGGFPAEPKEALVRLAEGARRHFRARATVVSGLRCQVHNANEGGVANSQHMYGEAVDLNIAGVSADRLLAYIKTQPGVRYAYKINTTNVHFDIPKGAR